MSTSPSSAVVPPRSPLPVRIDELWERRAELDPADTAAREAVTAAVDAMIRDLQAGNITAEA